MDSNVEERLMTAQQVARRLAVTPSTVYDAAARGELPVLRLWKGKRRTLIRFQRADIESFIRDRAIAPTSTALEGRVRKG